MEAHINLSATGKTHGPTRERPPCGSVSFPRRACVEEGLLDSRVRWFAGAAFTSGSAAAFGIIFRDCKNPKP